MKKILVAMVLFAFMALPMSVMAMTTMQDSDLSTVTGQSGVSIGVDISMNLSLGTVAWGDTDGLSAVGTTSHDVGSIAGGWVGIQNLNIQNLRVHMRTDNGMIDPSVAVAEAAAMSIAGTWTDAASLYGLLLAGDVQASKAGLLSVLATEQLLTIDVYTAGGTTGLDGKSYVRIGIPTFELTMNDLTVNAGLWTNTTSNTPGTYQSLGQVFLGGLNVLFDKNNYVDISQNDTTSGVLIHVANKAIAGYSNPTNKLMDVSFTALSWGDLDGLAVPSATGGAGYVGITGLNLAIGMDMFMNINVGTATGYGISGILTSLAGITDLTSLGTYKATLLAGLAANNNGLKDDIAYILHSVGTISATSVDIALSGQVRVNTIATQVVLADTAGLTGTYMGAPGARAGILGNLYVQGVTLDILGSAAAAGAAPQSWVSISAH